MPAPKTGEMKTHETSALHALQEIPTVGPAFARDLLRLGITRKQDLAGQDPDDIYTRLCTLDGVRHDPCVLDTFYAVVSYANGEPTRPWWFFSRQREAREAGASRPEEEGVAYRIVCSRTETDGHMCQIDGPAAEANGA